MLHCDSDPGFSSDDPKIPQATWPRRADVGINVAASVPAAKSLLTCDRELSTGMHRSEAVSLCHPVVPVFDGMAMITRDELLYPVAPPEPQQPVTDPAGESGPGTGAQIAEGAALVEKALCSRRFGPYTL